MSMRCSECLLINFWKSLRRQATKRGPLKASAKRCWKHL